MKNSPMRQGLFGQESEDLALALSPIISRELRPFVDNALRDASSMAEKYAAIGLVIQAWHSGYLLAGGEGRALMEHAHALYEDLASTRGWMNQFARTPAQRKMWDAVGEVLQGMLDGDSPVAIALLDAFEPRARG